MTISLEAVAKDIADLKRRVDLAETKLAQQAGQFEFISGQLRDIQLYMHTRFGDLDDKLSAHDRRFDAHDRRFDAHDRRFDAHDRRFDAHDRRFDTIEAKIDALPRAIAELISGR